MVIFLQDETWWPSQHTIFDDDDYGEFYSISICVEGVIPLQTEKNIYDKRNAVTFIFNFKK